MNTTELLRLLGARSLELRKNVFVCFFDYDKAFGRVKWCQLVDTLMLINMIES